MKRFAIFVSLAVLASGAAACPGGKQRPDVEPTTPDASTPEPDTSAAPDATDPNVQPDAAGSAPDAGPSGTPDVAAAPSDYVRIAIVRTDPAKPEVVAELETFEVLEANVDLTKLEGVKAVVSADAASVATGNAERDARVRGPDFLDVEKAPKITYTIDRLKAVAGAVDTYDATATIDMRGVSKEVPVRLVVVEKKADGALVVEVEAKDLARADWGITVADKEAPATFGTLLRLTLTNKVPAPK